MDNRIKVQTRYSTTEEFKRKWHNFLLYFIQVEDSPSETAHRSRPVFKRFQDKHKDLEFTLTTQATRAYQEKKLGSLPIEQFFQAYEIMADMVLETDPFVKTSHTPNEYLTL